MNLSADLEYQLYIYSQMNNYFQIFYEILSTTTSLILLIMVIIENAIYAQVIFSILMLLQLFRHSVYNLIPTRILIFSDYHCFITYYVGLLLMNLYFGFHFITIIAECLYLIYLSGSNLLINHTKRQIGLPFYETNRDILLASNKQLIVNQKLACANSSKLVFGTIVCHVVFHSNYYHLLSCSVIKTAILYYYCDNYRKLSKMKLKKLF
jgi:hypothetical protein